MSIVRSVRITAWLVGPRIPEDRQPGGGVRCGRCSQPRTFCVVTNRSTRSHPPTAPGSSAAGVALVVVAALVVAAQLFRAGARPYAVALESAVAVQFALGVFTLLHSVPVVLGVAHQAGAVVLLVIAVAAAHWSMGGARR